MGCEGFIIYKWQPIKSLSVLATETVVKVYRHMRGKWKGVYMFQRGSKSHRP